MDYKQEFIHFMVRSGVLTFGDFTAKSGRKTPYFINTGNYKTGMQAAKLGGFYADCFQEHISGKVDTLFGPAYKGIPLAIATAVGLYHGYQRELDYCFNRKEAKDHGEGGVLVGHQLKDGDKVVIIEDVITSGKALRESMEVLRAAADVEVVGMVISADRMERGQGSKSAVQEAKEEFGIDIYPIVNIWDIIHTLHNTEVDGKVYIDDAMRARMEAYLEQYGVL